MSLRTAIESLPDDRETAVAVREIVTYFARHRGDAMSTPRIQRVTGIDEDRVTKVVSALAEHFVVDCDGAGSCVYSPGSVLAMEVDRFLRTAVGPTAHLQRGVDRFRGRFGGGI